ncbi:MAG: DUF2007 domain-containing protein [Verrucomicrobiota bacterium]|nr:DUF2007 domain-containing protein [Verrucomicrobiota bacterium]
MDFVTVFQAGDPGEAQLIRARLEVAGFDATVANEFSSLNIEGGSVAAGGITVQVPADQADEARALIASENDSPS